MSVVLLRMATVEVCNILKYQNLAFDLSPKRVITNLVQILKAEKIEHETEKREYDTHTERVELFTEWRAYKLVPTVSFCGQLGESINLNPTRSWFHRMYNCQPLNIV